MNKLTQYQKNILIAEKMGWKLVHGVIWFGRQMFTLEFKGERKSIDDLPYYFTDLNACHEVEKILTEDQRGQMMDALCVIVRRDHNPEEGPMTAIIAAFFAPAVQRAEAIGVVLKLWKEGQ